MQRVRQLDAAITSPQSDLVLLANHEQVRPLTHITVYGLFKSSASESVNHVMQPFDAFSLQHVAAYL